MTTPRYDENIDLALPNIPVIADQALCAQFQIVYDTLRILASRIGSLSGGIYVNVKDYGATGNGVTDDYTSIVNAYNALVLLGGGVLFFPHGTYLISAQFVTADNSKVIMLGEGFASQIKKGFNGDLISLGKQCGIDSLYLEGVTATFTGKGVVISTGAAADTTSWRFIRNSWILNTRSFGVDFTANSAGADSVIDNCQINPAGVAAIHFPAADVAGLTRLVSNVRTFGNVVADLNGGSQGVKIVNCKGQCPANSAGAFDTQWINNRFDGGNQFINPGNSTIVGNKFTNAVGGNWISTPVETTCSGNYTDAPNIILGGTGAAFAGNVFNGGTISLAGGSANCAFVGNSGYNEATLTDNWDRTNNAHYAKVFATNWTSTGVAPAIGNGVLTSLYQRTGNSFNIQIRLDIGTTTTVGTGNYSFSLPFTVSIAAVGAARLICAGQHYSASCFSNASALIDGIVYGAPGGLVGGVAAPAAWAAGDIIRCALQAKLV